MLPAVCIHPFANLSTGLAAVVPSGKDMLFGNISPVAYISLLFLGHSPYCWYSSLGLRSALAGAGGCATYCGFWQR